MEGFYASSQRLYPSVGKLESYKALEVGSSGAYQAVCDRRVREWQGIRILGDRIAGSCSFDRLGPAHCHAANKSSTAEDALPIVLPLGQD